MTTGETPPTGPTASPAPEAYRSQAGHYDRRTDAFRQWRELLVASLPLRPGDTVLDVGCGTGLCAPLLHRQVGPAGTIIGIDESEQMLAVAAHRVTEHGWDNVRLIAAPVATAPIDGMADAALFCAVHDIMQSRAALDNIVAHLRPGSPVAATAANSRRCGCGRCGPGSSACTGRSSPTSPASTGPGAYWPSTSPTCRCTNSPSPPGTSPSATSPPSGR
jgi:SAM-dependent methyltransferase